MSIAIFQAHWHSKADLWLEFHVHVFTWKWAGHCSLSSFIFPWWKNTKGFALTLPTSAVMSRLIDEQTCWLTTNRWVSWTVENSSSSSKRQTNHNLSPPCNWKKGDSHVPIQCNFPLGIATYWKIKQFEYYLSKYVRNNSNNINTPKVDMFKLSSIHFNTTPVQTLAIIRCMALLIKYAAL